MHSNISLTILTAVSKQLHCRSSPKDYCKLYMHENVCLLFHAVKTGDVHVFIDANNKCQTSNFLHYRI